MYHSYIGWFTVPFFLGRCSAVDLDFRIQLDREGEDLSGIVGFFRQRRKSGKVEIFPFRNFVEFLGKKKKRSWQVAGVLLVRLDRTVRSKDLGKWRQNGLVMINQKKILRLAKV